MEDLALWEIEAKPEAALVGQSETSTLTALCLFRVPRWAQGSHLLLASMSNFSSFQPQRSIPTLRSNVLVNLLFCHCLVTVSGCPQIRLVGNDQS